MTYRELIQATELILKSYSYALPYTNMSNFSKSDVISACQKYGPQLHVEAALDGVKVMMALSSNESSYGANCGPRHEPAYDIGGSLSTGKLQQSLLAEFGSAAAMSYGPWQMMFINFMGYNPDQLLTDLDACASQLVKFFNSYVIGTRKAESLDDIGQVWNSGHISLTPSSGVLLYCKHLQTAYDLAEL